MKKYIALTTITLTSLLLAACGSSANSKNSGSINSSSSSSSSLNSNNSKESFQNGVVNMGGYRIRITKTEVIKKGGSNFSGYNVLAIWYEGTNISSKDYNSISNVFDVTFKASQNNGKSGSDKLNGGDSTVPFLPDNKYNNESQKHAFTALSTGESSKGFHVYFLTDLTTPVTLTAYGNSGNKLGELTYSIK